jgi:uncharacterized RDD family membrane protein YckC
LALVSTAPKPAEKPAELRPVARQTSLFPAQPVAPRVVALDTVVQQGPAVNRSAPKRKKSFSAVEDDRQQQLPFYLPVANSARNNRTAESQIDSNAPVASTMHRAMAAIVDMSMMIVAFGVFAGLYTAMIFRYTGVWPSLDRVSLTVYGALASAVVLFYKGLWILANGDSPGLRFSQLRLVDFNGRRPGRAERAARVAFGWLSLLPAALGLLWALVDEESLTWHDHITKTYPTPVPLRPRSD